MSVNSSLKHVKNRARRQADQGPSAYASDILEKKLSTI